jgi:hypothetical protein
MQPNTPKVSQTPKPEPEFKPDVLGEAVMTGAKYVFYGSIFGLIIGVIAVGLLMSRASGDAGTAAQVATNIGLFKNVMSLSAVLLVVTSAWLFWSEEVMVGANLICGALIFFAPVILPMVTTFNNNPGVQAGFEAFDATGKFYFGLAMLVLIADIMLRVRQRAIHGTRADQLKYGQNVKEESDRQNVFMGKCWQLPYCRKYVREKCPIFHSKRTCWRELVGCMCEESIIRIAMDNKPISKDALLSGAAIPRNNKLTDGQKRERCKNCVIYNTHQKHKYKIAMPGVVIGYALIYLLAKNPLATMMGGWMSGASKAVENVTVGAVKNVQTSDMFIQVMVGAFVVVMMAYTIKVVEFAIFKLKI